jgi:hypothetical protein
MRKTNDIMSTGSYKTLLSFSWFYWLILSMLLLSAASASASNLDIARPQDYLPGYTPPSAIATGVPFTVVVYGSKWSAGVVFGPGKISLPRFDIGTVREQAKLIDAQVDNPSIVEIIGRKGGVVTLRGKVPGETTLRVKARGKLGKTASTTVSTAVPKGVRMYPTCDDSRAKAVTPVQVPTNRELDLTGEQYSDKTLILARSFPEVDFGALIPATRKNGKATGRPDFLGAFGISVKTPATATKTSLKVPAYGYELPVHVYEPSAISEIRIGPLERICKSCERSAKIELLVGGEVPCKNPIIPLDVTIGPVTVCSLRNEVSKRKTDSGNMVYELPSPQNLVLVESAVGTCAVTVEAKGIGKSASIQIKVQEQPK